MFLAMFALTLSSCSMDPVVGPQGEIGLTGEKGEDGLTPYIGDNGNWWIGDQDTGIRATGPQGDQGDQGDKGDKGDQGIQGPQGPQGDQGDKGDQGDQGETGPQGEQGPQGDVGKDGMAGSDGKSAYELYCDAYPEYEGTEEEWLDDLANGRLGEEEIFQTIGVSRYGNILFFPKPSSIIVENFNTLGQTLPTAKSQGKLLVLVEINISGAVLKSFGTIAVQGSSTAAWPKKNWSIDFYEDYARTQQLYLKIGDLVESNKWVLKVDWVDPSLLRNNISFRLWEKMTLSRKTFPQYEVDNAWYGKNNMFEGKQGGGIGFPMPYPTQIQMDGEHYGLSMLLQGHEERNFNIDKNNPEHLYMEFDARGAYLGFEATRNWEKFISEGIGKWINGYHPKNNDFTQDMKNSIDELGGLINGSLEDFVENFDLHLDRTNIIDYLLFAEMIYDYDALGQDLEIVTYDLEKWYFLPWDKDTTFGMSWDEAGIRKNTERRKVIDYDNENQGSKLWFKAYHAFKDEVEARYAELRDKNIFTIHSLYEIIGNINKLIPTELWEAEQARWEDDGRPSLDETGPSQILEWFGIRLEMLDVHFNYVQKTQIITQHNFAIIHHNQSCIYSRLL